MSKMNKYIAEVANKLETNENFKKIKTQLKEEKRKVKEEKRRIKDEKFLERMDKLDKFLSKNISISSSDEKTTYFSINNTTLLTITGIIIFLGLLNSFDNKLKTAIVNTYSIKEGTILNISKSTDVAVIDVNNNGVDDEEDIVINDMKNRFNYVQAEVGRKVLYLENLHQQYPLAMEDENGQFNLIRKASNLYNPKHRTTSDLDKELFETIIEKNKSK